MISTRSLFPVLSAPVSKNVGFGVILLEKNEPEETYEKIKKRHGADKILRLSVFLTHKEKLIFAAPAGPDMNDSLSDLTDCAEEGAAFIRRLGIDPFIGIISGGREGDIGRNEIVDRTIYDAEALQEILEKEKMPSKHYTILIEDAVKEANFLILPDSLSGEMILKTVAGIGEGREIGNILLLKKNGGRIENAPVYLEQLTKKADPEDLKILKEALEIN